MEQYNFRKENTESKLLERKNVCHLNHTSNIWSIFGLKFVFVADIRAFQFFSVEQFTVCIWFQKVLFFNHRLRERLSKYFFHIMTAICKLIAVNVSGTSSPQNNSEGNINQGLLRRVLFCRGVFIKNITRSMPCK